MMLPLAAWERDFQDCCFLSWRWKSVAIWLSAKIPFIAGCLGWQLAGGLMAALNLADEVFGTPSRVYSGLRHSVRHFPGVSPKRRSGIVWYVRLAERKPI
ncbi:uncharacterized protein SCHCODRAFT_02645644 [Schizophyllum commune H4-8]|uniref:uncharacterized protein n=1 Tax=Schizophyllum commune (strain H4-8 / FGSC 9210) TaxID=578458 RepID=UPI0021604C90|nr:uncharacterized protein SCHCODRAFT_02645644 [Schizophyllum commune H4-8]KAI5884871.1 hypothetical protein SCHCODRAFT_02645644 [Schizophyllum commune H4-8]